jgi:predicted phosphate transport protein (TIGR00153 family)
MVGEYLDLWGACLARFREAMETYMQKGLGEDFDFLVERTHRAESKADDQRREIERHMYSEGLLPESRGDILGFLETMDRVPNDAESTLFMISKQRIELPAALEPEFRALAEVTVESTDLLLGLARRIFSAKEDFLEVVKQIDEKESHCDHIERRLIDLTFGSSEIEDFVKLQLRDLRDQGGGYLRPRAQYSIEDKYPIGLLHMLSHRMHHLFDWCLHRTARVVVEIHVPQGQVHHHGLHKGGAETDPGESRQVPELLVLWLQSGKKGQVTKLAGDIAFVVLHQDCPMWMPSFRDSGLGFVEGHQGIEHSRVFVDDRILVQREHDVFEGLQRHWLPPILPLKAELPL